jgi:hypothetical protein
MRGPKDVSPFLLPSQLRDVKFRTRAIRMGKNMPFESEAKENRDLVRTAMRIEELSDQVVEVTEFFQMNKLRLEDVTRERDQLAAYKRAAESRREISKNWNDLLSPKGVLDRAGMRMAISEVVDLTGLTPTKGDPDYDALDVSGSDAALAIEAAAGESVETAMNATVSELATTTAFATTERYVTSELVTSELVTSESVTSEFATSETSEGASETSETVTERVERKQKRQADFSILQFLGFTSAPEETPENSVVLEENSVVLDENAETNTELTELRTLNSENSETTTNTEVDENSETTTTTTTNTKMATFESSSVVMSASAESVSSVVAEGGTVVEGTTDRAEAATTAAEAVEGTGTPDEVTETKKATTKGFASLGAAIDKHGGDSDSDSDDGEEAVMVRTSVMTTATALQTQRTEKETTTEESEVTTSTENVEVEETSEEIVTTTTTTKTITTTTIVNSDGEEEELVEELTVVTDENGNVLNETSVVIEESAVVEEEKQGEGGSFWSRVNDKPEKSPDSDSD